jgi:hypothetical protein
LRTENNTILPITVPSDILPEGEKAGGKKVLRGIFRSKLVFAKI